MQDRRCRFGLAARIEMVRRREASESFREIAAGLACSPATVKTQCDRWREASAEAREDFSCLHPRRPVPKSCPHALTAEEEQRILQARERTNWGPMRLTALTGRHRSTIWKVLKRHGVSRRRRGTRQTFKRYEWSQPGALLHIDAYKAPKFLEPGHRVTGGRRDNGRRTGLGHTVVVAVQDDHTRMVYAELHNSENAANVSVTLRRAAAWFRDQGHGPLEAVMSDNAECYTGHLFGQTLAELGARHIRIPPYTPRWNGKIERFFGTLEDEWAQCPAHGPRERLEGCV
ncbi:MAG: DDE-type integrase/transposase/recombinase [Actinomycetota bacterium]|nr:DDE-type integrase/transposase/recombinase [Actinomycetota bacterium]